MNVQAKFTSSNYIALCIIATYFIIHNREQQISLLEAYVTWSKVSRHHQGSSSKAIAKFNT